MTTAKTIAFSIWTFIGQVMSLVFNVLPRLVIAFLPRSKCLLICGFSVTVCSDFGAQENYICHCFPFSQIYLHEMLGPDAMIFIFWMLIFKPAFSFSSFTFIKRLFKVHPCFLPLKWYHLHIRGCLYFSQKSWFQFVSHPAWHFAWCTLGET